MEEIAKSVIERVRALTSECKKISDRSVQTYENLAEDRELRKLESQLPEAKHHVSTVQAHMNLLTTVEKMKISQE
jgi:hypothetical protein